MHDAALGRVVTLYEPNLDSPPAQFIDYLSRPYLILLGDPGMGKTHTFKSSSKHENAKYMTVRSFLATSGMGCDGCTLYLDGLDEYRSRSDGSNLVIDLVKSLSGLNLTSFRLSCRAADWFGNTDLELFKAFFGDDDFAVLRLNALVDHEIATILQTSGVSQPQNFMIEAENRGLDGLLRNPQTLLMLSDLVSTESWPQTRTELFEKSALKLLSEHDSSRTRKGLGAYGSEELLFPAGAVCSALLISNVAGISLLGETTVQDYPSYRELNLEDQGKVCACLTRRAFEQVDPTLEAFSYVHRTIAEFLAAKWLVEKIRSGYPIRRIQNLIGVEGFPTSELRGLHAWITTLIPEYAHLLITSDPLGVALYGDAANLEVGSRSHLLEGLCTLSTKDPWFRSTTNWVDAALGSLSGEDMVAAFSEILTSEEAGFHLKDLVLSAIKNGPNLPQFIPVLISILVNKNASYSERFDAVDILIDIGGEGRSSIVDAYHGHLSSDQDEVRLRISILRRLYIDHFNISDLCNVLYDFLNSGDNHSVGELWGLDEVMAISDIPDILDNLSNNIPEATANYCSSRHELSEFVYKLLFKFMASGENLESSKLWGWLLFACNVEKYGHGKRSDSVLLDWFSGSGERKFELFESAFQSCDSDKYWLWMNDLERGTFGLYSRNEVIDFSLRLITKTDILSGKYVKLFGISGQLIFSQGHQEYQRFLKWLEMADVSPDFLVEREKWVVSQIEEWRQRENQIRRDHTKKTADIKRAEMEAFHSTKEMMRSGEHQRNLSVLAEHYFHEMREGVDVTDSISTRAGKDLLNYVLDGFCATLLRPDLPEAYAIGKGGPVYYRWWYTILAGLDESFRRSKDLSILPDSALKAAFSVSLVLSVFVRNERNNSSSNITLDWVPEIITLRPDLAEECLEGLVRGELECKNNSNNGIHALLNQVPDCEWRRELSLRLLNDFPRMDDNNLSKLMGSLLLMDCSERSLLLELTKVTVFTQGRVKGRQRAIWMVVGYMLKPEEFSASLKKYISTRSWIVWVIRSLIRPGINNNSPVELSVEQLGFLVELIASHFKNVSHPLGMTTGDRELWDAAEVVKGLINQISSVVSNEASMILEQLQRKSNLATYHDYVSHSLYNQLRSLREADYDQPDWNATLQVLQNKKPVNASDLHALLLDHLQTIKEEIRHASTSIFRRFWRHGSRGILVEPDIEDHCRDHLIDILKPRLIPLGLRVEPEGHMADDKRADIIVYPPPGVKLPLELKRDFHKDMWTACDNQLERLYTCDPEASGYGIYVVFWFGDERGSSLPPLPEGIKTPCTAVELEASLNSLIQEEKRHRLVAVVLDVASTEKPGNVKKTPSK